MRKTFKGNAEVWAFKVWCWMNKKKESNPDELKKYLGGKHGKDL